MAHIKQVSNSAWLETAGKASITIASHHHLSVLPTLKGKRVTPPHHQTDSPRLHRCSPRFAHVLLALGLASVQKPFARPRACRLGQGWLVPSRGGPLAGAHLKAEPPDLAPLLSLLSQASLFRSAPPLRQRIPLLGHTPAASPAHFIAARSPLFPCGLQSGYQYFPCLEPRLKRSLRSGQGGKERFGRGSALSGDAEPAGGGEGVRKAGLLRSLRSVKGTAPADTSFSSTQPPISLPPYSPFAAKPTATTHALSACLAQAVMGNPSIYLSTIHSQFGRI